MRDSSTCRRGFLSFNDIETSRDETKKALYVSFIWSLRAAKTASTFTDAAKIPGIKKEAIALICFRYGVAASKIPPLDTPDSNQGILHEWADAFPNHRGALPFLLIGLSLKDNPLEEETSNRHLSLLGPAMRNNWIKLTSGQHMIETQGKVVTLEPKSRSGGEIGSFPISNYGTKIPVTVTYELDGKPGVLSLTLARRTYDKLKQYFGPDGRPPYPWYSQK